MYTHTKSSNSVLVSKSYPDRFQFHSANRRRFVNVAIRSFPMWSIRKLESTWLISEIEDERVPRDEVDMVRGVDVWAKEEPAEDVQFQEETVDCLLGRSGWSILTVSENPTERGEDGNTGDAGDPSSSESFSRGRLGTQIRACSSLHVSCRSPVATNCSNV